MDDETRLGGGSEAAAADADLHTGQEFAGHRVEAEIGRGGMGVVYRALNLALERERALKVVAPALSADAAFRERFRRESRLAAQVEHPNVVAVHDAGEERGRLYIAMRLIDGADLRRLVEGQGPLAPARAARLIGDVAAGLDAAHERGLVHRDVKPSNVLVESARGVERAFLTDFGISRSVGADTILTSAGAFLGSVDYVAPEQVEGEDVDARTDVYALGAVLHFALTGLPPFRRDTDLAKLFAHANAAPPKPSDAEPELPAAIDEVVARAMAKAPAERYASAGELAADLAKAIGGLPLAPAPPAQPAEASEATTRRLPRVRRSAVALGAVFLAGGVAVAILLGGGSSGGPSGFSGRVLTTIGAGHSPNGLTVTPKDVWVASRGTGSITVIDSKSGRRTKPSVTIGGRPSSVAVGFGSVWATDSAGGKLFEIDPKSRSVVGLPITVGAAPSDVAVSYRWVWVSNDADGTVSRIDPATRKVRTIPVGDEPRAIAAGAGAVWVTNLGDGSISKINPSQATTVGRPILTPGHPGDIAVGAGAVWAVDNFDGELIKIDPATGRIETNIQVGTKPRGVKVGFGSVWVANGGDATVSRVDPSTGELEGEPIPVGRDPADIAIGAGSVWSANYDDGTVTRIDPKP